MGMGRGGGGLGGMYRHCATCDESCMVRGDRSSADRCLQYDVMPDSPSVTVL